MMTGVRGRVACSGDTTSPGRPVPLVAVLVVSAALVAGVLVAGALVAGVFVPCVLASCAKALAAPVTSRAVMSARAIIGHPWVRASALWPHTSESRTSP